MFKEKFIEARKKSGLNQTETAEKLGVSQAAVVKWEKGYAEPGMQTTVKIADLFNVSLDYLMREKEIDKTEKIEAIMKEAQLRIINDMKTDIYDYIQ